MKFPSIKSLSESFKNTVVRFPFEIAFALAGTITATTYLVHERYFMWFDGPYLRVIMAANLGLLLSLAATLFAESRFIKTLFKIVLKIGVAIIAACTYFLLNPQVRSIDYLKFFLLSLSFHLLVAFAGFVSKGHVQGFWQFNKTLFIRFLTAVLYSGVLYLGLMAAIEATKFLFGIKLWNNTYGVLWFWIAGMFNTLFFLSGIPANLASLDEDTSYPKGLKIFTQYVLIPLATVYVAILLAYEVKILIEWRLPKGLVSNLILGYSVFGLLSILLIYPVREQDGNKWIKIYARSFYFLLIPLIILLFLAIASRVIPYGITVPRYYLMVLALWLLFITIYFLLSKSQNIKLIPISLCILTLLSIYGPFSSFNISNYSQERILVNIFKKYGAYKDGKLVPLNKFKVKHGDGVRAQEELDYLVKNNDLNSLQSYTTKNLYLVSDSLKKIKKSQRNYINLNYSYNDPYELNRRKIDWAEIHFGLDKFSDINPDIMSYQIKIKSDELMDVKGYDYVFSCPEFYKQTDTTRFKSEGIKITLFTDSTEIHTMIINKDKMIFNIKNFADSLIKNEKKLPGNKENDNEKYNKTFELPTSALSITKQTPHYTIKLQISLLEFNTIDGRKDLNTITGYYLIKAR